MPLNQVKMCLRECVPQFGLAVTQGPHVHPIRTNQKAVIRAWLRVGGSMAVGGVFISTITRAYR